MKKLLEVNLEDVKQEANYIVYVNEYERHFSGETYLLKANGKEVFEFIKDWIGFDEDVDNDEDLFIMFDEFSDDGNDLISIFEA